MDNTISNILNRNFNMFPLTEKVRIKKLGRFNFYKTFFERNF